MSDHRDRPLLRRRGLPVALACALAASLGGCASWSGFGSLKDGAQAQCESEEWPTAVMGSVQHNASYTPTDDYDEVYVDKTPDTPPAPERAEEDEVTVTETKPDDWSDTVTKPEVEAEPPPVPPEVAIPEVEEERQVAVLPEPVAPQPPPPMQEVIDVCGAEDEACQQQLANLLSDPLHKWITEKPQPAEGTTRLLAFRVLTPVLACGDLRRGLAEAEAVTADIEGAQPQTSDGTVNSDWVPLLGRAVQLELKAEIEKRC
jgi:hypothetical protein